MADVKVTSNADAVAADMRTAARRIMDVLADEIADAADRFSADLAGPSPNPSGSDPANPGFTPYRTGTLLSEGNLIPDRQTLRMQFVNAAEPYRMVNGEARHYAGESYASHAHKSGGKSGQYKRDAERLWAQHMDADLESRAEAALAKLMGS